MATIAALPTRTRRRWDALAADQLRAELARVSDERDALAARVEKAEHEAASAYNDAHSESNYRGVLSDQLDDLLATARRAGITLNVRPIGLTIDGQIGLVRGAP